MTKPSSRRTFAALAVSALAGCVSVPDDDSTNGSAPSESTARDDVRQNCTDSMTSPDPYPDIQIEHDAVPEDADVAVCVEPVEPFTDDSPARFAVAVTNVSAADVEYLFGVSPPYGSVSAVHERGDDGLYLLPDDRTAIGPSEGIVPEAPTDHCWRSQSIVSVGDVGFTASIAPGETVREAYTVLASPDSECLLPGTYRSEVQTYDPVGGGPWGFDITLSG